MLRQRILTAAVLIAILLPVLAIRQPWPFALLALAAFAVGAWEWARLNGAGAHSPWLAVALGAVALAAFAAGWSTEAPREAWWIAFAAWVVGGIATLRGGTAGWPHAPRALRLLLGLVVLWAAWLALANARTLGLNFVLSVFVVVWAADVFAYFGGRAFGSRKLAPGISPNKSWEGVWSGIAGALAVAVVWLAVERSLGAASPSLFARLDARFGWLGMALVVVFLVGMSVVGDLVESLVKRSAGAKDSSQLLPGHGGVLDRVDALLPVFPIALALASA
jgi:phosphatidate cytidylyltransferase